MAQYALAKKELPSEYTIYIASISFTYSDQKDNKEFYDDPAKKSGSGTVGATWQLPLPTNITENNTHEWEISKGITEELAGVAGGALESIAGSAVTSSVIKTAQSQGITIDPNYRQIYNGSTPRTFTFEWALVPSSLHEADLIINAITAIKAASLPGDRQSTVLITPPDSFLIRFGNQKIDKLVNIRECVATNVTINYTGQGYGNFYAGGYPKKIDFSVTFSERYTLDKKAYLSKSGAGAERGIR